MNTSRSPLTLVLSRSGRGSDFDAIPAEAGVYAVYDNDETLQYIGLSRKIKASVKLHMFELPELCFSVRCEAVKAATTLELQEEWKKWILEYLAENKGKLPPVTSKATCSGLTGSSVQQRKI